MTSSPDPLEANLGQFENAWINGETPKLEDYLPSTSQPEYLATLEELVIIDLEFRWKLPQSSSNQETLQRPAGLESYLQRFPVLQNSESTKRLAGEEFIIRRQFGDQPSVSMMTSRFPDFEEVFVQLAAKFPIGKSSPQTIPHDESHPQVRNYEVIGSLGEGGMGSVYLAQQEKPVRRKVALKVIRRGLDSKEVIARFEAERQALAMMDHQNIARVFDAGMTRNGQPFFAMEYVNGIPITDYCRRQSSEVRERLQLFLDVCAAVQHAHQKGILHRDLKPSNVLIAEEDGRQVAKVIDFGLAKAVDSTELLTDKTIQTHVGQVLGTLKYMSPEQATTQESGVDTRADVYALGVMLYELLTGETPLNEDIIREQTIFRVLELIRDHEPIRPSQHLVATSSQSQVISAERSTTTRALHQSLAGDLDWIVMKALEKDPERRYDSASSLAEEIRRFLNDEPVVARPPSAAYRLSKFARKNRGLLAALTFCAVALLAGTVFSVGFAIHAGRQRQRAERATAQAITAKQATQQALVKAASARKQAEAALAESQQSRIKAILVADFMTDTFSLASPNSGGRHLTVTAALDQAIDGVDRIYAAHPGIKATLWTAIAKILGTLGQNARAIELCERALKEPYEENAENLDVIPDRSAEKTVLANLWFKSMDREKAIHLQTEVLNESREKMGPEHEDTIGAMVNLVGYLDPQENTEDVIRSGETAHALSVEKLGALHKTTLLARQSLGKIYCAAGDFEKAIHLHDHVIKQLQTQKESPAIYEEMQSLGEAYLAGSRHEEGIQTLQMALAGMQKMQGRHHMDTLRIQSKLTDAYHQQGDQDAAIVMMEQELQNNQIALGPTHPITIGTRHDLATHYTLAGEVEKAVELRRDTYVAIELQFGEQAPETLQAMNLLVNACLHASQFAEAVRYGELTLQRHQKNYAFNDARTVEAVKQLAIVYQRTDSPHLALDLWEKTYRAIFQTQGVNDPTTWSAARQLTQAYSIAIQMNSPVNVSDDLIQSIRTQLPRQEPEVLHALFALAQALSSAGHTQAAIRLHGEVLTLRHQHLGQTDPDTLMSLGHLSMNHLQANELERALPLAQQALAHMREHVGPMNEAILNATTTLQTIHRRLGQPQQAVSVGEATLELFRNELADEDPLLTSTKYWLAICNLEAGDLVRSIELHRDVLDDRQKQFGKEAPETIHAMGALITAYRHQGNFRAALEVLPDLLTIQETLFGKHDARTLDTIGSMAFLSERVDDFESGAKYYAVHASRLSKHPQPDDVWTYMISVSRQCYCLVQLKRFDETEQQLRWLLPLLHATGDWYLFQDLKSLRGEIELARERYAEAEELLLSGHAGLLRYQKQIPEMHAFLLTDSIKRLVRLYRAWEKPDLAAKWRGELNRLSSVPPDTAEQAKPSDTAPSP